MEITHIDTKHYIEMYFPTNGRVDPDFETSIQPVMEKNPLLFDSKANADVIVGFKFFDVTTVVTGKEMEESKDEVMAQSKNHSPMFYFGRRFTRGDLANAPIFLWLLPLLQEQNSNSVIFCDCGNIILNPEEGSMTVEEYKKQHFTSNIPKQLTLNNFFY